MSKDQKDQGLQLAMKAYEMEIAKYLVVHGHIKDAKDIDLTDVSQRFNAIMSQGNKKVEIGFLEKSYKIIADEIIFLTLYHFNSMTDRYNAGSSTYDLDFVNRPIYGHIKYVDSNNIMKSDVALFSHSSPAYNYMHTMFKALIKDDIEFMTPAVPFTYSKKSHKEMSQSDLLRNFKYKESGVDIPVTIKVDGKTKENPDAVNVFLREIDNFQKILKNAFSSNQLECELLEETDPRDASATCGNLFGKGFHADSMMGMHLCTKMFLYAQKNVDLCLETDFDNSALQQIWTDDEPQHNSDL